MIEGGEGAQQERQPLLARDSSNEDDGGGMRIDAVSLVNIGRRIRLPRGDIDAVMHDVDARGIYFRVRAEDVLAHSPGDGDDAVGVLVSGFFRKRAKSVPALQLLGFPGAQWFEGVSR